MLGTSAVNYMFGSKKLMCSKNHCLCSVFWMIKVLSICLNHSLGRFDAELMTLVSKPSMKRLTTMGLMGEPMAASWTGS